MLRIEGNWRPNNLMNLTAQCRRSFDSGFVENAAIGADRGAPQVIKRPLGRPTRSCTPDRKYQSICPARVLVPAAIFVAFIAVDVGVVFADTLCCYRFESKDGTSAQCLQGDSRTPCPQRPRTQRISPSEFAKIERARNDQERARRAKSIAKQRERDKEAERLYTAASKAKGSVERFRLLERSCNMDHADACNEVGFAYRNGVGVAHNDALADFYRRRACDLGLETRGCRSDAEIEAGERGDAAPDEATSDENSF